MLNRISLIIGIIFFWSFNIQAQKTVISSVSMIEDMVRNIAGDRVISKMIVPIGGDPHLYEPLPADAKLVASADLVFINGLTFEGWITELILNSGTKASMVTVTEGVNAISSDIYKNSSDPHAWMDVTNGLVYIDNIKKSLIELEPTYAAEFEANYKTYKAKLEELDRYITQRIQEIPAKKRVLITSHDAFKYYGRKYGLQLEAIVGVSTEAQPETSDIIRISKAIKETEVPAIFIESTINPKLIKQIAVDNKVSIGGALYADSIGEKGSSGDSYIKMLKSNTDVIVDALAKGKNSNNSMGTQEESGSRKVLLYAILGFLMLLCLGYVFKKMNK